MRNKKITIKFFCHTFKYDRMLIVIVCVITITKFFSIRYIDIDKTLIIFINCLLFNWYIIRSTTRKIIFKNDIIIFEKTLFFFLSFESFRIWTNNFFDIFLINNNCLIINCVSKILLFDIVNHWNFLFSLVMIQSRK